MQLLQLFTENTLANSVTVSDIPCWVLAGAKAAAKSPSPKRGKERIKVLFLFPRIKYCK